MQRRRLFWIAAALLTVLPGLASGNQDCGRPKTTFERLVCSNDRLSHAQNRFAFAYFLQYRRAATDDARADLRREQREWETSVRDACMDIPCLMQAFEARTLEMEQR